MLKKAQERLAKLEARRAEMVTKAEASQNAEEVRSLTAQIKEVDEEIEEVRAMITEAEERAAAPEGAETRGAEAAKAFKASEVRKETVTVDRELEYRNAFWAYASKGTPIPAELRDAATTADTGAAIPMTIVNDVINTIRKRYGNLYRKVRKLSVQGGVAYPVGALQGTFKWINESTVSPRQNPGSVAKVTFSYHTAEIRIAQSFLAAVVTLSSFEARFTEIIVEAFLQEMDRAIVKGTGEGQPLGIINDPRVTNVITLTAAQIGDWTKWRKEFFAKLPLGYRSGEFIFPVSTVDSYLETMADNNNNPIYRQATGLEVNDGDAQNPNGRFFGRAISLVEEDILPDFDTANAGDVIGIYWQPEEYAVNENFAFTMRRYFDEETNEWVNKALVVIDGKVLNPTGYYLIKKG